MARPRSDIIHRVVQAARGRFLVEGVDGASLRAIALDARTSIGMVTYYFPSKDTLFLAVVEEVYVALLRDLEAALDRTHPVSDRILRLYRRLGNLSTEEAQVVRLVLREALASPARLARLIRRFQRGHVPLLLRLVQDGAASGLLRDDLAPGLLVGALAALGGPAQIVLGLLAGRLPARVLPEGGDRAAALADVLLHGIGARTDRRGLTPERRGGRTRGAPRRAT